MAIDFDDIKSFKNGNTNAAEKIFDEYYSIAFYLAINLLGNKEDAISSDFFDFWQVRENFDSGKSSVKTYLLLLTRRRAIDILRNRKEDLPVDDDVLILISQDLLDHIELREQINAIINSLNTLEKEMFYRRFFYAESYKNISKQTGKSIDSIKSTIKRMRQNIRENFDWRGEIK